MVSLYCWNWTLYQLLVAEIGPVKRAGDEAMRR